MKFQYHSQTTSPSRSFLIQPYRRRRSSALFIDLINIGSQEAVTIAIAAILLFGVPKFSFFKKKNNPSEPENDNFFAEKWRRPYKEKLQNMSKFAREQRAKRGLQYLEEEIQQGNEYVLSKVEEFERMKRREKEDEEEDDESNYYDEDDSELDDDRIDELNGKQQRLLVDGAVKNEKPTVNR